MFERYIHRNGKKLGPYYYENVRTSDGKVKTVYVGTNPRQHTKHKARKPLFFLILVLVLILILGSLLFVLQNRDYLIKKVSFEGYDFEIDQILLKVLVKSSEFVEKELRVMNTGSSQSDISIEVAELSDIVAVDPIAFTLKPGHTKIVALNFSSFIPEEKIEQQPAIYVGRLIVRSEKASREIPIVVEVETKNVLFDMNLNPVALERKVKQGAETSIEIRLFNLKSIDSENVDIEYFVKDTNGNTIQTESETVVVKTQASFFKTISVPRSLKPGPYVFAAQTKFGNSIGTASYLFEVTSPEEQGFLQFCRNSILCLGLSLTTVLLLFALMAYFYFFVGAYLYEKFSGDALPRKRKDAEKAKDEKEGIEAVEEPEEGIFKDAMGKISRRKEDKERIMAEEQRLEAEKELQSLEEERKKHLAMLEYEKKTMQAGNLNEFRNVLNELRNALGKKDISKLKKLHNKAREAYVSLLDEEKREIFNELLALHKQISQLVKEKKLEELSKQRKLEAKLEDEKKRLEEEKRQILLQKEKENQEQQAAHALGGFYHAFDELKGALKNNDLLKAKRMYIEARNIYSVLPIGEKHGVYHKLLALHRHMGSLVEEKKRQEELKKEYESKKQKESEKQKLDEERKRKQEELAKQREAAERAKENERQKKRLEKEKRAGEIKEKLTEFFHKIRAYKTPEEKRQILLQKELEGRREGQRRKERDQEKIKLEEPKKEQKPTLFGRLFKAKERITEKKPEGKIERQKAPQTEFEELEEAIRNLGLFKEIEKGRDVKEKSRFFGRFFKK